MHSRRKTIQFVHTGSAGLSFFRNCLALEPTDTELLSLLFLPNAPSDRVGALFSQLDIDALPQEKVALLSQLALKCAYDGVPKQGIPRLKGFSRFLLTHNAKLILGMVSLAKELAPAGIPLLLCKGVAMRLYYQPRSSRHMWDVDVAVPPEQFDQAVRIAQGAGCKVIFSRHAASLFKGYGSVDLHNVFYKTSVLGLDERGVWRRSVPVAAHACVFQAPGREDMLLQVLTNEFSNLVTETRQRVHLKWAYDAGNLLQSSPPDWNRLFSIAEECRVTSMITIMLALLREILPDIVASSGMPDVAADRKTVEAMASYHARGLRAIERYQKAKKSKKMYRYIWFWLPFTWHYHNHYLFGLSFWQRLKLFPANCKALFHIRSWWEFPAAALRKMVLRFRFDQGIR